VALTLTPYGQTNGKDQIKYFFKKMMTKLRQLIT